MQGLQVLGSRYHLCCARMQGFLIFISLKIFLEPAMREIKLRPNYDSTMLTLHNPGISAISELHNPPLYVFYTLHIVKPYKAAQYERHAWSQSK